MEDANRTQERNQLLNPSYQQPYHEELALVKDISSDSAHITSKLEVPLKTLEIPTDEDPKSFKKKIVLKYEENIIADMILYADLNFITLLDNKNVLNTNSVPTDDLIRTYRHFDNKRNNLLEYALPPHKDRDENLEIINHFLELYEYEIRYNPFFAYNVSDAMYTNNIEYPKDAVSRDLLRGYLQSFINYTEIIVSRDLKTYETLPLFPYNLFDRVKTVENILHIFTLISNQPTFEQNMAIRTLIGKHIANCVFAYYCIQKGFRTFSNTELYPDNFFIKFINGDSNTLADIALIMPIYASHLIGQESNFIKENGSVQQKKAKILRNILNDVFPRSDYDKYTQAYKYAVKDKRKIPFAEHNLFDNLLLFNESDKRIYEQLSADSEKQLHVTALQNLHSLNSPKHLAERMLADAGWVIMEETEGEQKSKKASKKLSATASFKEIETKKTRKEWNSDGSYYEEKISIFKYILRIYGEPVGILEVNDSYIGDQGVHSKEISRYRDASREKGQIIRFAYVSNGTITSFADFNDTEDNVHSIFSIHRPETLRAMLGKPETVRNSLCNLPTLETDIYPEQFSEIITNLESCYHKLEKDRTKYGKHIVLQMYSNEDNLTVIQAETARLLKHTQVNRILYLTDTQEGLTKTVDVFHGFCPHDELQSLSATWPMHRITNRDKPSDARIYFCTIQRMFAILTNSTFDDTTDSAAYMQNQEHLYKRTPERVYYNPVYLPEFFDMIFLDNFPRSYTTIWHNVLRYFNAPVICMQITENAPNVSNASDEGRS